MARTRAPALLMTLSMLVAACGGGSSSEPSAPPDPAPPSPAPPPPASTADVAGSLLIAATSQSDGDVNDPSAPFRPNDSLESAQPLPVPVILGGYVNEPARGPAGRSYASGDRDDIYVANLEVGQVIELIVTAADPSLPDYERDDADVALHDASGALVDESVGLGQLERIMVPAAGRYFIRVAVYSGAPLYALTIGQAGTGIASSAPDLRLNDDFIPGDAIVRLAAIGPAEAGGTQPSGSATKSTPSTESALATAVRALESKHRMSRHAGAPGREMLVRIARTDLATPSSRPSAGLETPAGGERAEGLFVPPALQAKAATLQAIKRLRLDPAVATADVNRILRAHAEPSDRDYRLQRWHYEMIRLPAAWNLTRGSSDVIVAVVDTGVVRGHPDLEPKLVGGFDFIGETGNEDGDGIDAEPDDPGCSSGGGSIFHGTHVAGTVGAVTDNGEGVAGAGWNVRIMPLRALDGCAGTGSSYDVAQAVRYAAGLPNDSGNVPPRRADVINLSLGAPGACDASSIRLFADVKASGTVVVASAGNESTSSESTPAACPGVVAVAAVDSRRERASYSNSGPWVDIAAPGGDMRFDIDADDQLDGVLSTHASGGGANREPSYRFLQGTSMAAAHVAGVIGLLRSADPTLTPERIESLLVRGKLTKSIRSDDASGLGAGLIDAFAAIKAITTPPSRPPATLAVTPTFLDFGDVATSFDTRASNVGSDTMVVQEVRTSASWLTSRPASVDVAGLGRYTISVERRGLSAAPYQGWVEFVSSAGVQRVAVLMRVGRSNVAPDGGRQYVLLLIPDTESAVLQSTVRVDALINPYRVPRVSAGSYVIVAGTDMNNNGVICDDGEACGAYPGEPERGIVPVGADSVGALDFTTALRTAVDASQLAPVRRVRNSANP